LKLYFPSGLAVDVSGNLYIADQFNNRIRKVDISSGIITTVAGNGAQDYSGDNGPAMSAAVCLPTAVAFDYDENLYIADTGNQRIRKVDTKGIITTVAGNGAQGYSGDNGPATSATFYGPIGIALDARGNLYIADLAYSIIRKVDTQGIITTFAGNGTPGYSGDGGMATNANLNHPEGVAFDGNGDLYIADETNYRIRKVTIDIFKDGFE
jgi:sugar lactone lactonase YvrE